MRWAKPIRELVHGLPVTCSPDIGGIVVTDVVEDTRDVSPGCLFVARPGDRFDGRSLIPLAIDSGAIAILSDEEGCRGLSSPTIATSDPAGLGVEMADRLFDHPAGKLPVIAITGTNGKTTTATYLQHMVTPLAGLIGSIEINDTRACTPSRLTTPGGILLRRFMARMIANDCRYLIMEASSHGIALGRLDGLQIAGAIMTNLSGDHLDFHGTMERYQAAKRALFASLPSDAFAVLNMDDPAAAVMAASTRARLISCRREGGADADVLVSRGSGAQVNLEGPAGRATASLAMPGDHNAMNLAQAYAAACAMGHPPDQQRLDSMPTPRGRLEPVGGRSAVRVFIDFAHTDEALRTALVALRPLLESDGRLFVVFGCGGDRDRTKRPRMGAVASRHADVVVVTSDNPRTESPGQIISDVLSGLEDECPSRIEPDRAAAIEMAIQDARRQDIVLIAGKGHESVQLLNGQSIPFDDRQVALEILERIQSS
tara:strand:- start:18977 stop:20434 length:1458 start_codon:yes stop_codon:yes gene_type:complete